MLKDKERERERTERGLGIPHSGRAFIAKRARLKDAHLARSSRRARVQMISHPATETLTASDIDARVSRSS
jgi:hypothetical protein